MFKKANDQIFQKLATISKIGFTAMVKINLRVSFIVYRGGLGMQGTSVIIGTRYAWNAFRLGLDMPGTFQNFEISIIQTSYTLGPI